VGLVHAIVKQRRLGGVIHAFVEGGGRVPSRAMGRQWFRPFAPPGALMIARDG